MVPCGIWGVTSRVLVTRHGRGSRWQGDVWQISAYNACYRKLVEGGCGGLQTMRQTMRVLILSLVLFGLTVPREGQRVFLDI